MAVAQHMFLIVFQVIDDATKQLQTLKKQLAGVGDTLNHFNKKMRGFDMNALSLMFFGMALKRFFGGALKSLMKTYNEIMGKHSEFINATTHLRASWDFLKVAIMNTLNSERFIEIILSVRNLIDRTSEWVQKNEDVVSELVKIAGYIAVGGSILVGVNTLKLGFGSMSNEISSMIVKLNNMDGILGGMVGAVSIALTITDAMLDENVTPKDLFQDALGVSITMLTLGKGPGLALLAITTVLRFQTDPIGFGESIGKIVGTLTSVFIWLSDFISATLKNAGNSALAYIAKQAISFFRLVGATKKANKLEEFLGFEKEELPKFGKGLSTDAGLFGRGFEKGFMASAQNVLGSERATQLPRYQHLTPEQMERQIEAIDRNTIATEELYQQIRDAPNAVSAYELMNDKWSLPT